MSEDREQREQDRLRPDEAVELTYPLRAAARLTGLSPDLLRAWERRHGVVEPRRTPGGTRRYSAAELERLRLVKAAVDAGHRIGEVAQLPAEQLRACIAKPQPAPGSALDEVHEALERLDAATAQRLLALRLAVLGPAAFAREVARPLVHGIGERWAAGRLGVASEHLATSILRSLLGSALQPTASSLHAPRVVFATPSGEPHELGLLMAALTALGAGAQPLYLGAELPEPDLVGAVAETRAAAVALSLVTLPDAAGSALLARLREALDPGVAIWIGGAGAGRVAPPAGVERLGSLEDLERRTALLGYGGEAAPRPASAEHS